MARYTFLTTWILDASRDDVWQAIYEVERWPEWWPGVRSVEQLEEGDAAGIGALYRHEWRSVIPYPVRFDARITRIEPRDLIEADADGELAGVGRWRFFGDARDDGHLRVERAHDPALDEPRRAAGPADLPLEPQRGHAQGRPRTS